MLSVATSSQKMPIWFVAQGTQTPVVFVHGQLFDHTVWTPTLERVGQSRPAAIFDMPGHGLAPLPDSPTIPGLGQAILDVLDSLGWTRAIVVGHSLGATAAIHASCIAPSRVAALVLVGLPPAQLGPDPKRDFENLADAVQAGYPPGIENALVPLWYSPSFRNTHSNLAQRVRRVLENNAPASAAAYLRALAAMPSMLPLPAHVSVPTTVIAMADDAATPFALSEPLAIALQAELVRIPGGHLPFEECPEALASSMDILLLP